jgi:hypothetical protein
MAKAAHANGTKGIAIISTGLLTRVTTREAPGIANETATSTAHTTSNTRGTGLCGQEMLSVIKAATPSHEASHPDIKAIKSLRRLLPNSGPKVTMPDDSIPKRRLSVAETDDNSRW